jgi:hypothetical protein
MTHRVVDSAGNIGRYAAQVKADGFEGTIRYLSSDMRPARSKNIFAAEARSIAAAGLMLGLVWEDSGGTHNELTGALGTIHATRAVVQAKAVGAPGKAGIYFACDSNPQGMFFTRTMDYLAAAAAVVRAAGFRMGVYGPGKICTGALDAKDDKGNPAPHVDLAWLANAHGWSGYQEFLASKRWVLLQHLPQHIPGVPFAVDPDELRDGIDFAAAGFFKPFSGVQPDEHDDDQPAVPHDLKWVQQILADNGNVDPGPVDGRWGPRTEKAVVAAIELLKETAWPDQA